MAFWNVVKDGERFFAEHYIYGRTLYDVDITTLAAQDNEFEYSHIGNKTWADQGAVDELRQLAEKCRRGELG